MTFPVPPGLGRVRRKLWDQVRRAYSPLRKRLPVRCATGPTTALDIEQEGGLCVFRPRAASVRLRHRFIGTLTTLLRQAEGEAAWRSAIGFGSGVLFVALVLSGNEIAVAFRADDLDPQIARYAFDEGQAAFANARVALGSFAGCCGWVIASTRSLPRWLGWLAIASGVGLAISRISWTSYTWLPFYLMFWLWVVTVAGVLLRRSNFGGTQSN